MAEARHSLSLPPARPDAKYRRAHAPHRLSTRAPRSATPLAAHTGAGRSACCTAMSVQLPPLRPLPVGRATRTLHHTKYSFGATQTRLLLKSAKLQEKSNAEIPMAFARAGHSRLGRRFGSNAPRARRRRI